MWVVILSLFIGNQSLQFSARFDIKVVVFIEEVYPIIGIHYDYRLLKQDHIVTFTTIIKNIWVKYIETYRT